MDDKQRLILEIWMLRARRAAKGHALTIPYYRKRDQIYTFINVFLAITVVGISSVAPLLNTYRDVFSYAIPAAAILNVLLSALQYINDFGVKATHHERASALYARVMREIEHALCSGEVDDAVIRNFRDHLDFLGMTSAYPPEGLRDKPKELSSLILMLEAKLDRQSRPGQVPP